jgi:thiamine pyrophosphate-dependent acetolactate synthase large subunit-like protein
MNPANPLPAALDRRAVVARMLRERGDALVVTSLGNPSFDVAAAGDCAQNFYLWGAMGGAVMVGLGLALAQPGRRVLVFVGDGEMMMGLGSLATAAAEKISNLSVVVIDNEHYAETGMQAAHSGRGVNLPAVALAVGFVQSHLVRTPEELDSAIPLTLHGAGPVLVTVKVGTGPVPTSLPPRDGPYLRSRFRTALLGADAHA